MREVTKGEILKFDNGSAIEMDGISFDGIARDMKEEEGGPPERFDEGEEVLLDEEEEEEQPFEELEPLQEESEEPVGQPGGREGGTRKGTANFPLDIL